MIAFYIAFFGLFYILIRLSIEQGKNRRYNYNQKIGEEEDSIKREKWIESTTNTKVENSILQEILESDEDSRIAYEIGEIIKRIEWFDIDLHTVWLSRGNKENYFFLLRIVLANRGLIAYEDAVNTNGIYQTKIYNLKDRGRTGQEYTVRLFLWIQKELEKHNVYTRPVFVPSFGNYEYDYVSMNNIYINNPIVWEQMVPYYAVINEH